MRLGRIKKYLRENWGAPFVMAFTVLLIFSATQLSLGLTDPANNTAVYAFYVLVLGVVLQIASSVKYGEGKPKERRLALVAPSEPRKPITRRQKFAATGIVTLVLLGSGAVVAYYYPPIATVFPHLTCSSLSVRISFNTTFKEPNGSSVVSFGVGVICGELPYSFKAVWSDNLTQLGTLPVFTRTLSSNQTIPAYAVVTVTSSDGKTQELRVIIKDQG
jgi:hypothetical protein